MPGNYAPTHVNSTRGPGRWSEWEADEIYGNIRTALGEGLSDHAVARRVGCADKTVARYRERHNIPSFLERSHL